MERVAFGLNGAIFLIEALDGFQGHAASWTVALNGVLGVVQLAALLRARGRTLPERLAYLLAAVGMFASALATLHHRTGLPYAYALAGALNLALAFVDREALRRRLGRSA